MGRLGKVNFIKHLNFNDLKMLAEESFLKCVYLYLCVYTHTSVCIYTCVYTYLYMHKYVCEFYMHI